MEGWRPNLYVANAGVDYPDVSLVVQVSLVHPFIWT